MVVVSVYKGSEAGMTVFGLSFGYGLALGASLILSIFGYIFISLATGGGLIVLAFSLLFFLVCAIVIFRLHKKFGKGGIGRAIARKRTPAVVKGGILMANRLKEIEDV